MELLQHFKDYIEKHHLFSAKDKLLLAVSGGVDSVVLCELCRQAGYEFVIAHCNFKLRAGASDSDEQFVKELAGKYGVDFYNRSFDTKTMAGQLKKSIEETARDLRYNWFYELLDKENNEIPIEQKPLFILTGHHADDNIETVVMNFFRGTGIKGIRGILPKNNKVIRPLLFARRREIEDFAFLHQLQYVSDHTNFEVAFTRNFFRNRIIPEVVKFFPGTDVNILHNAERFAEVEQLYEQAIVIHKAKLLEVKGNETHIPILKLKKAQPLRSIVFEIIKDFGFTAHQTDEVIALLESESGRYIASASHRIIRNRNWLIIAPAETTDAVTILIEKGEGLVNFALGALQVETANCQPATVDATIACLDAKEIGFPLLLRKWKTGDYFYPLGMQKKKKLGRFFIDQKLSKTEKENAWVVESNKCIIWVVGHRIDDRFKLTPSTREILRLQLVPSK